MDNYKKFGVAAGQVLMGLGFSLLGEIVGLIFDHIASVISGKPLDLFESLENALIGFYIGLLTGVCLDGYKFLRQNGRQHEFLKFLLVSIVGVSSGLFGLYWIVTNSQSLGLSNELTNLLAIAVPLIGILLGSILILTRDKT